MCENDKRVPDKGKAILVLNHAPYHEEVWVSGGVALRVLKRLEIFLLTTASRPAPGPTQPPIQFVPEVFTPGVKWPGREADHSPTSSTEVKNT